MGNIVHKSQFYQILTAMTAGFNQIRPQVNFSRTPGQSRIVDYIEYYSAKVIKIWQEALKYLSIKFNVTVL